MPKLISNEELLNMSESLKALAHPDRIKIIMLIMKQHQQKMNVTEIYKQLDLLQPETSRHLNILKSRRILKSSKEGHHVFYTMNPAHPEFTCVINCLTEKKPVAMLN